MGNIPVPIPHIGQLLLGCDEQGRSDVLYYLVLGEDGGLTVWKHLCADRAGGWERPPIPFNEFDEVYVDGLALKEIIAREFASL